MSVLQTGMFRTKWPPWVNRKFRTGRHSSQLFKKLDVKVDSSNIEDCHWLPGKGPKRVDVKFSKRKNANRIRKVKKNVKGMDLPSVCIRSLVYINDSLCKYYKMLWRKWKKLSVNKFIHSFWVSNGSIRLKLSDNKIGYDNPYSWFGRAVSWKWIQRWRIGCLFSIVFYF